MNLSVVLTFLYVTNHKSQITSHKSHIIRQHLLPLIRGSELGAEELAHDDAQQRVGGHGENHGEDTAEVSGRQNDDEDLQRVRVRLPPVDVSGVVGSSEVTPTMRLNTMAMSVPT